MTSVRSLCIFGGLALLMACSEKVQDQVHVGYVEADWIYMAAPQSGWLSSRPVREGDQVSKGQVLFTLDKEKQEAVLAEIESRVAQSLAEEQNAATGARPAEIRMLEAQLSEARARLNHAVSERDRILPLVEQGMASLDQGELVIANTQIAEAAVAAAVESVNIARQAARPAVRDAAKAGVAAVEAQRARAEVDLQERTVLATVAGRVEEVFHHPGEFVSAGSPVLALLSDESLKVKFFVSQEDLPAMIIGQRVHATADGKPDGVDAVVSFIAAEAEFTPPVIYSRDARDKLVFLVEATLPAGSGFSPGLPVDVDW